MSVQLLSPFTQVFRRSAPKAAGVDVLTGRWFTVGTTGEIGLPTGIVQGNYLCLEGNLGHKGSNLDFAAGPGFESTNFFTLPSVVQSGECALAYGVFRYEVGPEGCDPLLFASLQPETLVMCDAVGRIIPRSGIHMAIGKVEAIATDANGVTKLTVRTFGN